MLPPGIAAGVPVLLFLGGLMVWRAEARTNKVALVSRPKPATVVRAQAVMYRPTRTYVGLLDGGYVSPNEAEQKSAQSTSEMAQLESERANLVRGSNREIWTSGGPPTRPDGESWIEVARRMLRFR